MTLIEKYTEIEHKMIQVSNMIEKCVDNRTDDRKYVSKYNRLVDQLENVSNLIKIFGCETAWIY